MRPRAAYPVPYKRLHSRRSRVCTPCAVQAFVVVLAQASARSCAAGKLSMWRCTRLCSPPTPRTRTRTLNLIFTPHQQRRREKEEDARAREALRRKLEEDRKERRRKLGLPEELTEEEEVGARGVGPGHLGRCRSLRLCGTSCQR